MSNASVIQTESVKTQIPWYWSTTSSETNFNVFPKSLQRKWDPVVIFIDRLKSVNKFKTFKRKRKRFNLDFESLLNFWIPLPIVKQSTRN